jgi:flagellar basal-body rod modification protein FlgD
MTDGITPTQETGVNQTDYMKLFMQELTYQDPLKPVDNREFMAQMAQFSSLQEARTTNEWLSHLVNANLANQSLMMLGKEVKIEGTVGSGTVKRIIFSHTEPTKLVVDINGVQLEKQLADITDVLS